MKLFWIAVILTLSQYKAYAQQSCCEEYCLGRDSEQPQRRRFTSKTAYQLVKGDDLEIGFEVPNCTPTKVWILSRHGTRLPYFDTIVNAPKLETMREKILNNYLILQTKPDTGALCMEDFLSIQSWKFNSSIKPEMARLLTFQGWENLKSLAKTYQTIFPDIFPKQYDAETFLFRHTQNQRAEESFRAFSDGLFGPNVDQNIDRVRIPEINDTLLRSYLSCPIWKDNNWKSYNTKETEYYKFKQSKYVQKTLADVSRRLGFQEPLDFEDVELMWDICRLEQAWHVNRTSVWCGAFTPSQLIVLEYLDDLKFYRNSGYGHEINTRVACTLVKDMLLRLDNNTKPSAIAYFAHSNTIETLITSLGFVKDKIPPTASNFESMSDRQWKTSVINPFSSNLVAVKFECTKNESDNEKAMFFLNQERVDLDWCKEGLCDWSKVLSQYKRFHNANCTEYFCSSNTSNVKVAALSMLVVLVVVVALFA